MTGNPDHPGATPDVEPASPTPIWRVIAASTAGTVIEWYDFYIYGTASALVFGKLFFPSFDPLTGTLAAFAAFALGFVVRPFGGLFFGYLGDRWGRRPVLIITLLMMGLSTAAIGLLPGYDTIGVWAPILLLVLRVLQGFGAGAEYGGAILMAFEYAPKRRGFYCSWPAAAVDFSTLLAAGVMFLFFWMTGDQFLVWGWRVPFLLSLVVLALGVFIRRSIAETPAFLAIKKAGRQSRMPAVELVRTAPRSLLFAMGACACVYLDYIFQVFTVTYVPTYLGLSRNVALVGIFLAGGIGAVACIGFGALSDRIGRKAVMGFGAIFSACFAFPFFWMLETRIPAVIWLAIIIAHAVGMRAMYGPQPAFLAELFDVRVRYTGIALSREMMSALIGGPAPFVATALTAWAGGAPWPVATLIIALGLVAFTAIRLSPSPPPEQAL